MMSSMSLSRSSDIDKFWASSQRRKALKMDNCYVVFSISFLSMIDNLKIDKYCCTDAIFVWPAKKPSYPNCGIFRVVDNVHVDHMHWGLVLCLPLGEVLQCLVINLEILVQISFHDLLYTYMYASNCIMHIMKSITFSSTVSIISNSSLHSWNLSGPDWREYLLVMCFYVDVDLNDFLWSWKCTFILLFLSMMWSIPFFV